MEREWERRIEERMREKDRNREKTSNIIKWVNKNAMNLKKEIKKWTMWRIKSWYF